MRAGDSEKKGDRTHSGSEKECSLAGGFQSGPRQEKAYSNVVTAWSLRESLLNEVGQGLGEWAGEAMGKPPHPRKVGKVKSSGRWPSSYCPTRPSRALLKSPHLLTHLLPSFPLATPNQKLESRDLGRQPVEVSLLGHGTSGGNTRYLVPAPLSLLNFSLGSFCGSCSRKFHLSRSAWLGEGPQSNRQVSTTSQE